MADPIDVKRLFPAADPAAIALYDTPAFASTPLRSPIPPPDLQRLLALLRGQSPPPAANAFRSQQAFRKDEVQTVLSPTSISCTDDQPSLKLSISVAAAPKTPTDDRLFVQIVVDQLIDAKRSAASVHSQTVVSARAAANPYEALSRSVFINRAATKLAAIDANFRLTDANSQHATNNGLAFADLCAGPGGFTEYILWRRIASVPPANRRPTRGWGITLRTNNAPDFDLDNMLVPRITIDKHFEAVYGPDGSGDIFSSETINLFADHVLAATASAGVDLVVADGAFSVIGDETYQEIHSQQILLCEILTALKILKKGGNFVVKCFDIFTPLTAELVYILYNVFESISIVKPFASRPANSERYIVCKNLVDAFPSNIIEHLHKANDKFNKLKSPVPAPSANESRSNNPSQNNQTSLPFIQYEEQVALGMEIVTDIIDRESMFADTKFIDYIESTNNSIATKQSRALKDIVAYAKDPSALPYNQIEIRDKCLREWRLPLPAPLPQQHQQQQKPQQRYPRGSPENHRGRPSHGQHRYQPYGSSSQPRGYPSSRYDGPSRNDSRRYNNEYRHR